MASFTSAVKTLAVLHGSPNNGFERDCSSVTYFPFNIFGHGTRYGGNASTICIKCPSSVAGSSKSAVLYDLYDQQVPFEQVGPQ